MKNIWDSVIIHILISFSFILILVALHYNYSDHHFIVISKQQIKNRISTHQHSKSHPFWLGSLSYLGSLSDWLSFTITEDQILLYKFILYSLPIPHSLTIFDITVCLLIVSMVILSWIDNALSTIINFLDLYFLDQNLSFFSLQLLTLSWSRRS